MASDAPTSRLRETALAVIEAYNSWDMTNIMAVRAPECINHVLPKSLGRPTMDNEAYHKFFSAFIPHIKGFRLTVHDIIEDERANKIAIWASSSGATEVGSYANEYMLTFHFNDAGGKMTRFYEFVDASFSQEFFPKLAKHMQEKKAAEEQSST